VRRFCLLICVLSVATFAVRAQKESKDAKQPAKAEQQLIELNQMWAAAINKGDAATLDRLFADDLVVTASNGTIRDKAGEIKDAAGAPDPEFIWTSPFTTEDVRIRVYQDAAVVTGLAKWGFKYKGQEANNERRYTHTYVKLNGEWKIVAQQTSSNLYKKP
jgi:uncharacterized protein (TIGR02246 family)